jgi:futalosine hydrolase
MTGAQLETESGAVLWLVPTELERQRLLAAWRAGSEASPPDWQLCGFGPIAAGVLTAGLLADRQRRGVPVSAVVLMGIGGSYDLSRADLGAVVEIGSIATDTVGAELSDLAGPMRVGVGPWQLPSEMGFPQVAGRDEAAVTAEPVFESVVLPHAAGAKLLTVGIASGSEATAAWRRQRFPGVLVEDMEGFAVALACRQLGVPCRILRGISNAVGDRRVAGWRIEEALGNLVLWLQREQSFLDR